MWRYRPRLTETNRPDECVTLVRTPAGAEVDVTDPALAAELGHGARVIRQSRGIFDTAPLSLLTTQTVRALSAMTGAELAPLRFRPNLLVEAAGAEPFPEDAWVGAVLERQTGRPIKRRVVGKGVLRLLGLFNRMLLELVEMHYLFTDPVLMDDRALEGLLGAVSRTPYLEGIRSTLEYESARQAK